MHISGLIRSSNPTLLSALLDAASVQHYFIQKGQKGLNKVTEDRNHTRLNTRTLGAWRQKCDRRAATQVGDLVEKLVMELEDMERSGCEVNLAY